jgi:hypothetical protein
MAKPEAVRRDSAGTDTEAFTPVQSLPLVIRNTFTWPQPEQSVPFEADATETGEDLHRRVAAHIGYLALDVILLRQSGHPVENAGTLAEQGLANGDVLSVRLRSCLSSKARPAVKGEESSEPQATPAVAEGSLDALMPSAVTLERYCRSAFVLSCLESMPAAPVLLRMCQLDHGCVHARAHVRAPSAAVIAMAYPGLAHDTCPLPSLRGRGRHPLADCGRSTPLCC